MNITSKIQWKVYETVLGWTPKRKPMSSSNNPSRSLKKHQKADIFGSLGDSGKVDDTSSNNAVKIHHSGMPKQKNLM